MKNLILGIFLTATTSVKAEYRVYQYIVKNKVEIKDAPNGHMVTSTLDPISYIAYNGGYSLLKVDLLRTWVCPGYTGQNKQTCNSPYGKLPAGILE